MNMKKPYIICHMVTSIDAKVTGDFLYRKECEKATEIYYHINRKYKSNGFICGRVTMEGSFTGTWQPDLEAFDPILDNEDYIPEELTGFYAVSFDPKGKLGWKAAKITDEDPGYDNAQVVEVLTHSVDRRYLAYLKSLNIPYIFAGKDEIDVCCALEKLSEKMGIETLLLEGGSIVNGYFARADVIDELSLVVAPSLADKADKPLFMDGKITDFELKEIKQCEDSVLWMNYRRKKI